MLPLKVGFDVDGVFADFIYGFTTIANKMYDTPIVSELDHKIYRSWDISDWYGLTEEQVENVWEEIRKTQFFWTTLPSMVSSQVFEDINRMQFFHDVYFITSRSHTYGPPVQKQTAIWLAANGINNPAVIPSKKKGKVAKALGLHFMLEDHLKTAEIVHTTTAGRCMSFVINRTHNMEPSKYIFERVNTVEDYIKWVIATETQMKEEIRESKRVSESSQPDS